MRSTLLLAFLAVLSHAAAHPSTVVEPDDGGGGLRRLMRGSYLLRSASSSPYLVDDDHEQQSEVARRSLQEELCDDSQCFAVVYQMCLHRTSQECKAQDNGIVPTGKPTERPTKEPTAKPVFAVVTSVHPVKVILENVAEGYKMTSDVRALIIRVCAEILEGNTSGPLEFVEALSGGFLSDRRRREQKLQMNEEEAVALDVRVRGPQDTTDFALSYIIETLQDNKLKMEERLREYDVDSFRDVVVKFRSYKASEIVEETDQPTGKPTQWPTPPPTPRPQAMPLSVPVEESRHALQLVFNRAPAGYTFPTRQREALVHVMWDILSKGKIAGIFDLVEVTIGNISVTRGGIVSNRRLQSGESALVVLPFFVTVEGPDDENALSSIIRRLRNDMDTIEDFLRGMDSSTFRVRNVPCL